MMSLLWCVRKIAKSDYQFHLVCLCVRMEQLGSHLTDLHEILIFDFFCGKFVEKVQVSLKSAENNECFAWRPKYINVKVSLLSYQNENGFRQRSQGESQYTFMFQYIISTRCQVTEFILSDNCSTCFGRHYHPSSGAQNNSNCSIW